MPWIFFWMPTPWDNEIAQSDWDMYLAELSWEFVLYVLISVALICGLYAFCARRLKKKENLLRPFWPMRLLWVSVLPGVAVGLRAMALFESTQDIADKGGEVATSISSGLFAVAVTVLLAWLSFLFPRVTPAAFALRPRAWFLRKHN